MLSYAASRGEEFPKSRGGYKSPKLHKREYGQYLRHHEFSSGSLSSCLRQTNSQRQSTCVISDRDPRFVGGLWKSILNILLVDLLQTTAYSPKADGQSERTNQVIDQGALRVWGKPSKISPDLDFIAAHAISILRCSASITYIHSAKVYGTIFEDTGSTMVSGLDTEFFVDHQEPNEALSFIKETMDWKLEEFEEGHEFLLLLQQRRRSARLMEATL